MIPNVSIRSTIVVLTQTLRPLPDDVMMTMKLLYFDDGKCVGQTSIFIHNSLMATSSCLISQ